MVLIILPPPQLRTELDSFDPSFFEKVVDVKFNYQEAVKKYEQQITSLSQLTTTRGFPPTFTA